MIMYICKNENFISISHFFLSKPSTELPLTSLCLPTAPSQKSQLFVAHNSKLSASTYRNSKTTSTFLGISCSSYSPPSTKICITWHAPEKQNQKLLDIPICKIYYKEWTHTTTEAEKSQDLWLRETRELMLQIPVWKLASSSKTQEPMLQFTSKGTKKPMSHLKVVKQWNLPLTEGKSASLFFSSLQLIRATHNRKRHLFNSVYWFKC